MAARRLPSDRRRRLLLGSAAALALPAWPARGQANTPPANTRFAAGLRSRLAEEGVGLAAARVGPEGIELQTLGLLRQGERSAVTPQSLFDIGSITKAFVALALADGVLRKEWAMDDPVDTAMPGLRLRDAQGEPLRLSDLATHRSGLPRMPGDLNRRELTAPYEQYSEARLQAYLQTWQPRHARGEVFGYSNLGYGLLALVLARRAGLSVDALLEQRVFQPLGISGLFIRRPLPRGDQVAQIGPALMASLERRPREASGHLARRPIPAWEFEALAGAIGLVGTVESLARFMQAALGLFAHPLAEAFAMCLRPHTEGEHPLHPFGLAWELAMVSASGPPRTLFNQDGATNGFSCSLWIEPGRRRGCAVLSNAFMETRSLALLGLDPGITEADFSRAHPSPEALAALAGDYLLGEEGSFEVRSHGSRLFATGPGLPRLELLAQTERQFFTRDNNVRIDFDDAPRPRYLVLHVEGQTRRVFQRRP
jgi:CubicO group peptidase (beta-lactamase class C family)